MSESSSGTSKAIMRYFPILLSFLSFFLEKQSESDVWLNPKELTGCNALPQSKIALCQNQTHFQLRLKEKELLTSLELE